MTPPDCVFSLTEKTPKSHLQGLLYHFVFASQLKNGPYLKKFIKKKAFYHRVSAPTQAPLGCCIELPCWNTMTVGKMRCGPPGVPRRRFYIAFIRFPDFTDMGDDSMKNL